MIWLKKADFTISTGQKWAFFILFVRFSTKYTLQESAYCTQIVSKLHFLLTICFCSPRLYFIHNRLEAIINPNYSKKLRASSNGKRREGSD
jgi:hypothetical protein